MSTSASISGTVKAAATVWTCALTRGYISITAPARGVVAAGAGDV
jgi:hypothetical protein